MRIAIGGIHTECSTYSPLHQVGADFDVVTGPDLIKALDLTVPPDCELIPLFHARSLPGGSVEADVYASFKSRLLRQLRAAGPLDGVFLAMHGAMHVVGLDDPEGDWIADIRSTIGPDIPIAVSYDLHGNFTQRIVDAIDIFAAYRTAPHIDVAETVNRAMAMLVEHLGGGPRPFVGWVPIPVLLPGERTSTEDEPAAGLYRTLPEFDARHGILDANILVGYVWADTPRATAAAVVTGLDRQAIDAASCKIAKAYWDARAEFSFGVQTDQLDACLANINGPGPIILADSGDNPTGGGVGDRADVLAAVLASGITGAVFAGIADAPAALAAADAGIGGKVPLRIGGSLGSDCPVVEHTARVLALIGTEEAGNLQAMVEIAGNRVILSRHRRPYHNLSDFAALGITVADERLVVVKSGYLSPELAPLAAPPLMALTNGAVNQDIPALENTHRPRPTYPFQTGFDWQANCLFSARASQ